MQTVNIKFVAYLRFKEIHPDKIHKIGKGRAKYQFDNITEEKWLELKQEFDRSEHLKYAQCLDAVVDLAY